MRQTITFSGIRLITILCVSAGLMLLSAGKGWGQSRSIAALETAYTEDFNTLTSGDWTNGVTVTGWYARTDATASITTYGANTGTTTAAGLYAFGVEGTNPLTDRALGYSTSNAFFGAAGTGKAYLGWRLKNNTGETISSITVVWTGEQWRKENNAAAHSLHLFYQVGETMDDLIAGTWTTANSSFTSPITGATTATALDGNAPANRVVGITATINVTIADGAEIMLRWEDLNDSGNDHHLAIDDVSVTAYGEDMTTVATPVFSPPAGEYTSTQSITITSATTGATIHYTTNGTDPTTGSPVYSDPIEVSTTTTIKALAVKDGMDDSSIATALYSFPVTRKWSGGGTATLWSDADNWSPAGVPMSIDDVILDNSILDETYTVILPTGGSTTTIASLTITPGEDKEITLQIPSGNTANPGLSVTTTGDAVIINNRGVFLNSTGASAGSGLLLAASGVLRINNGGTYIHNTIRAHATEIAAKLSSAAGTENGNFVFDVSGVAAYSISASGRTYGNMVLRSLAASGSKEYTIAGASPLNINGSLFISEGVTLTSTMTAAGSKTIAENLTIEATGALSLGSASRLTVNGNLTNNATEGIFLKSPTSHGAPGSLIVNGSISGTGTMTAERHILPYSAPGNADGWHLISSPLGTTSISGNTSLEPGAGDDFYAYSETTAQWLNWKVGANNITTMGAGQGYLVAYELAATKTFTGTPNHASVPFSNLSVSPAQGQGWHLLGNPFQSAIIWNDHADWNINNIGGIAKVMSNTGSFTDVLEEGIIPAMQGFWVQAVNETNSITIPLAARTHDATTAWNKSTPSGHILLAAKDLESGMEQESRIRFNPGATAGFDLQYDSRFMAWYAPQFYSLAGTEKLSTNTLPQLTPDLVVPMGFKKNAASQFSITLKYAPQGQTIFLHDLVAGEIRRISDDPVYTFTARAEDPELRFRILFDVPTNAEEPLTGENDPRVYAYGRTLYVQMPAMAEAGLMQVFDISGRVVYSRSLPAADLHAVETSLSPGVYVVRLSGRRTQASQRVVVW